MATETMNIEEVKAKVSKGLERARWKLLESSPFIGEMLLRFSIIPTYDNRCNTACTDGKKVYFDCEFYSTLSEGKREFVLAHEVWHNIFLHFSRQMGRDVQLWNIATDMEINHMLQNEGMELIENCCLPPPEVAGKNAEDIYAFLMKQQNKKNNQNQKGKSGDSSNDSSNGGSGDSSDKDDSGNSSSNQSNGSGKPDKGNSNSSNGGSKGNNKTPYGNQFDQHVYEGDTPGEGEGNEPTSGKWGEKGTDENFKPNMGDAKEFEDRMHDAVCSVAQSIERKKGNLPAGIDNIVKEILKPEINWKEKLSQFVTQCFGGEHHWRRCSRHALGRGMYLPGRTEEKIKAALVLDTSGSYLQDLPKFLAEFESLVKSFGNYEITLVQCDCAVQDVKTYNEDTPIDFKGFKVRGGGGSDFRPAFKYLRENGDDFNCVIAFTDGYIDVPTYAPPYPALFVLPKDGNMDFCEWGEKMVFKADNK